MSRKLLGDFVVLPMILDKLTCILCVCVCVCARDYGSISSALTGVEGKVPGVIFFYVLQLLHFPRHNEPRLHI